MSETIEILYKCKCMSSEVKLRVPARRGPSHDVALWMNETVASGISEDHGKRSPKCRSTKTEFVKIPIPAEGGYVGEATEDRQS